MNKALAWTIDSLISHWASTPKSPIDGPAKVRIAIVGGGFSGVATALRLMQQRIGNRLQITLIERDERVGAGVAFGTIRTTDLLNVPAGRMSVYEDDPLHFCRWLLKRGGAAQDGEVLFAPRRQYSDYLRETLQSVTSQVRPSAEFNTIRDEAIAIRRFNNDEIEYAVQLRSGASVAADAVVLATGWQGVRRVEACTQSILESSRYVDRCWSQGAFDAFASTDRVLVLGTGLSMFDTAMTLDARGHGGHVTAISRRGLLPQSHAPNGVYQVPRELQDVLLNADGEGLSEQIQRVRDDIRNISENGQNWRAVFAALRPLSAKIWQSWSTTRRRRFLIHVAPYWDVHRHRCSPQASSLIRDLQAKHQLTTAAGRVTHIEPVSDGFQVTWLPRGFSKQDNRRLHVHRIVNCLGPETDVRRSELPVMQQLLKDGLICPDELGWGIRLDANLQTISSRGNIVRGLHVIGPILRGNFGEATAVPELRQFATQVADQLLERVTEPVST